MRALWLWYGDDFYRASNPNPQRSAEWEGVWGWYASYLLTYVHTYNLYSLSALSLTSESIGEREKGKKKELTRHQTNFSWTSSNTPPHFHLRNLEHKVFPFSIPSRRPNHTASNFYSDVWSPFEVGENIISYPLTRFVCVRVRRKWRDGTLGEKSSA
jgi:hypothetical protein